ncbi:MAG: cytochrome c family protein [Planctomycetes bacterium]|nr:cytochrome c family protein [Planctomycetota bacterium]MCC7399829.1 hypothetical protein [Planctomycetota bacterium]
MHPFAIFTVGLSLLAMPFLSAPTQPGQLGQDPVKANRFIGANQCKNCHKGQDKGNAYDHWMETPHAKAFETLATDKAKEVAKKAGIDDPQKSEKCLKCHVTAYGVDKKELKATFKAEHGVQCETCHGPGENHQKKRFAEASKKGAEPSPITPDEMRSERKAEDCEKCHNSESPTFKEFHFKDRMKDIEHLDPRKKRTEEEIKKLRESGEKPKEEGK